MCHGIELTVKLWIMSGQIQFIYRNAKDGIQNTHTLFLLRVQNSEYNHCY